MRDVLILLALAVVVGLSGLVYELARRGGTLRRSGPWTETTEDGGR